MGAVLCCMSNILTTSHQWLVPKTPITQHYGGHVSAKLEETIAWSVDNQSEVDTWSILGKEKLLMVREDVKTVLKRTQNVLEILKHYS